MKHYGCMILKKKIKKNGKKEQALRAKLCTNITTGLFRLGSEAITAGCSCAQPLYLTFLWDFFSPSPHPPKQNKNQKPLTDRFWFPRKDSGRAPQIPGGSKRWCSWNQAPCPHWKPASHFQTPLGALLSSAQSKHSFLYALLMLLFSFSH